MTEYTLNKQFNHRWKTSETDPIQESLIANTSKNPIVVQSIRQE